MVKPSFLTATLSTNLHITEPLIIRSLSHFTQYRPSPRRRRGRRRLVVWEASPVGGKSDEWDINSDIYWGFKI